MFTHLEACLALWLHWHHQWIIPSEWKLKWVKEKPKQTLSRWATCSNKHKHSYTHVLLYGSRAAVVIKQSRSRLSSSLLVYCLRFKNKLKRISFHFSWDDEEGERKKKVHKRYTWEIELEHSQYCSVVCQLSVREVLT